MNHFDDPSVTFVRQARVRVRDRDLLNDTDRARVMADIKPWIAERLQPMSSQTRASPACDPFGSVRALGAAVVRVVRMPGGVVESHGIVARGRLHAEEIAQPPRAFAAA